MTDNKLSYELVAIDAERNVVKAARATPNLPTYAARQWLPGRRSMPVITRFRELGCI